MKKKLILLVNVGTPEKPNVKYVGKYLLQFLNDRRVIDLPWLMQKILVNLIIVPFRVTKSVKLYKELWTVKGSPLYFYQKSLVSKLQIKLKDEYTVVGAMRYGTPSLKKILDQVKNEHFDEIRVLPLYPQFASSTTGSVHEFVMSEISNWEVIPEVRFISQFYSHPAYIKAFTERIKSYHPENFDQVLFSFHGLPVRQVKKAHPVVNPDVCDCERMMPEHGRFCYKATCFDTSRLLAKKINISQENYTTTFQSRFSNNWLAPFTDVVLDEALSKGQRKILIVAPSFVTDCLETTVEIEKTYKQAFIKSGGEELVMVESLNDTDEWVDALIEILQ
ncbi:MAG: ferrochelatase [Paludibacter sp.]|nr:ferrochelatase [Paludibacter sp.]